MQSAFQPVSVTNFVSMKKYENIEAHPVQRIQDNKHLAEEEIRMQAYSNAFGSHMPLKLTMERLTTAQSRRLPGLKSSNLGLEVAMNRLSRVDYEDWLSNETPYPSKEVPHLEVIRD